MAIQLFIFALIAAVGAGTNFCQAAETTTELEMLGAALEDLETAPLGSQIRAEGALPDAPTTRHRAYGGRCVAYYLEVTLVSVTTDSDNNDDYHYYRVFKEVRGTDPIIIESGRVKLALPLEYWTRFHRTSMLETSSRPAWLDPAHKIPSYRGSFRRYEVETLCLQPGATVFVAGSVASVTEAGQTEAASERLYEIRNPLISLRPSPARGPIDLWPGTGAERIGALVDQRTRKRIYGGILSGVTALLVFIGALFARHEL